MFLRSQACNLLAVKDKGKIGQSWARLWLVPLSFTPIVAWSATKYELTRECGKAEVVAGDTCSNVKVEFQLKDCASSLPEKVIAQQVICKGHTIKARIKRPDTRYEAAFEKIDGGWSSVQWKKLGPVQELKREPMRVSQNSKQNLRSPAAETAQADIQPSPTKGPEVASQAAPAAAPPNAAPAEPPAPARAPETQDPKAASAPIVAKPAPAPAPAPAAPSAPAAETQSPFKFSAFFDVRYTHFDSNNDLTAVNGGYPESGFGIEDGALYASYNKDRLSVVGDLAFRRGKDGDYNTNSLPGDQGSKIPNESSNSLIALGVDKSQLYIKYALLSSLNFYAGQFDTPYGVEVNDSKDRVFAKTGMLYDNLLPVTHTGSMVEYVRGPFAAKAFAANPNNKGSFGSSATGDDRTEYGGALTYSGSRLRGQLGYMSRPITEASGTSQAPRYLIDATAGVTLGRLSLDLEYSLLNDPNKNVITPTDLSDHEQAAQGFLGLASFKFFENWLAGLRYEHLQDFALGSGAVLAADSYAGSVHYKLSSELELRGEFTYYHYKLYDPTGWIDRRAIASALVNF